MIRYFLANERCGRVVLDFLSTTDVGRRVPAEQEAVSVSEAAGVVGGAGGGGCGAGRWGDTTASAHGVLYGVRRRGLGGFICLFSSLLLRYFLGAHHIF